MSNTSTSKRASVSFAAIDPYLETNILSPKETLLSSKDMVEWGTRNAFPDYLLELYNNVPTLRSIINGNIDFVAGDDATILPLRPEYLNGEVNRKGETIIEQIRDLAKDQQIYGGFALQVIRNLAGEVAEIYYIDMRFLRCNKDCNVFYYCEDWNKRNASKNAVVYPAFMPNLKWETLDDEARKMHASSILFVKNVHTQTYPSPIYAASVKACELERCIDDFHLNSINNSFAASMIINFNNGIPDERIQEEIEQSINEKFAGYANGSRIMLSWNKNKESATDIISPKVEDFGARYQALETSSRQKIFTAFRAIPLLFGLTSEANTGFSTDEFEQSFKLYNRTQIRPIQRMIADAYDKIYGQKGVVTITPFSLGGSTENIVK